MMLVDNDKYLVVLPGPPREMKPMFDNFVIERLRSIAGDICVERRVLRVSGMGESALDELIAPVYKSYPSVQTSILFNRTEVEVHLSATAATKVEASVVLDELVEKLSNRLGVALFSTNGETLERVVGTMLSERNETLSVAESCTGGLIGVRLTDVEGASAYFLEGAITYSNEAKIKTLDVPAETLKEFGAVSSQTAEAMAAGMRERTGSDHAISVTGIAGPGGGSEEKPVGTVFIGYADKRRTKSVGFTLPGDRELIRWRSSQAALDYLRRQLLRAK
jgi:nicotinamide-nucleotide amidase